MPTKDQIVKLLMENSRALGRALVVLNESQTQAEQTGQYTINSNGVGFTPADARMGTSMAIFYSRYNRLSEKQIAYWRQPNAKGVPRICKYSGQLLRAAEAKAVKAQLATQKPAPVNVYIGQDIGNLMEERMVLLEQMDACQEGACGDGEGVEREMDMISARLQQITEAVEEIRRCEFKMNREIA